MSLLPPLAMPETQRTARSKIAAAPVGWAFMMGVSPVSKTTRAVSRIGHRVAFLATNVARTIVAEPRALGQFVRAVGS